MRKPPNHLPSVLADRAVRGDNHGCARDVGSNLLSGFAHQTFLDLGAGLCAVPGSRVAGRPPRVGGNLLRKGGDAIILAATHPRTKRARVLKRIQTGLFPRNITVGPDDATLWV
jgi:hypothetical protein